jgi:integrase
MTNERAKPGREYLTKEEVDRLLIASKAQARNPARDYAMLLLMFRHGLRVNELCALKLSDVSTKEIHVNREKGSDSGVHELLDGEARAVAMRSALYQRATRGNRTQGSLGDAQGSSQSCGTGTLVDPSAHAAALDRVRDG